MVGDILVPRSSLKIKSGTAGWFPVTGAVRVGTLARARGKWVLVESWNEGGHTYHVVRLEFEDLASDILDVIKELPLGAKIWETLQYGDTVEIVFRTVATIAAVA